MRIADRGKADDGARRRLQRRLGDGQARSDEALLARRIELEAVATVEADVLKLLLQGHAVVAVAVAADEREALVWPVADEEVDDAVDDAAFARQNRTRQPSQRRGTVVHRHWSAIQTPAIMILLVSYQY